MFRSAWRRLRGTSRWPPRFVGSSRHHGSAKALAGKEGRDTAKTTAFESDVIRHGFDHYDPEAGEIPDHVDLRRLEHVTVPLDEIRVASERHLDPTLVRRYQDKPPRRKPVLRPYGDDSVAVVDGHHTIAAARARGETDIKARWMDEPVPWRGRRTGKQAAAETVGPFYHGTRQREFRPGDLIIPGHEPNFPSSSPHHVYLTENIESADSYSGLSGGHIYRVEPTGPVERDPEDLEYERAHDVTFQPGDRHWRTGHPLRVIREVSDEDYDEPWDKQAAEQFPDHATRWAARPEFPAPIPLAVPGAAAKDGQRRRAARGIPPRHGKAAGA
jgi:hypothetical protein